MRQSIILLFSMIIFMVPSCNHNNNTISHKLNSQKASIIDTIFNKQWQAHLESQLNINECPGAAIAIIKDDEVIYEYQYGSKSVNHFDPIDDSTVFRIGSVSKGFAGVLAGVLIDQKIICLDDPVSAYVPELTLTARTSDRILRIKHILSHSTGLTEHAFSNLVDENHDMETLISSLNRLVPRDSTGIAYAYQNAAYGMIEKVIERATGLTYSDALKKYILTPLDMTQTSSSYDQLCQSSNICEGHKWAGKYAGFVKIPYKPHYYNVASAGGVNSTLSDMKKWLRAVMGYPNKIGKAPFDIAFTPQVNTSYDDKYFNHWAGFEESHYGLGWRLIKTSIGDYVYHGGLVNGFRAEIAYDKRTGIGMVVMFNSTCKYSNYIVPEFYEFWHHYHNPQPSTVTESI
jgi:beta-lactamase class C